MGTEFEVLLVGPDRGFLEDAAAQVLEEPVRLEEQLSHYRPDSDISDLNLRAPHESVRLEPLLYDLLTRAMRLAAASEGAFDPACGALIRCWGFFRGRGRLPEADAVREALLHTGCGLLTLDPVHRSVRFGREGVQVHLGAVGKGYALDCMADQLRALGVQSALLHGGTSSVYALGGPADGESWEVGLCHPDDRERRLGVVQLRDRALSTSGDYEQFFEVEGRRYSHILDPRTGYPAGGVRSATVVAASAADTDALSTAAFVLGVEGTRRLHTRAPGFAAVLIPEAPGGGCDIAVRIGDIALELG